MTLETNPAHSQILQELKLLGQETMVSPIVVEFIRDYFDKKGPLEAIFYHPKDVDREELCHGCQDIVTILTPPEIPLTWDTPKSLLDALVSQQKVSVEQKNGERPEYIYSLAASVPDIQLQISFATDQPHPNQIKIIYPSPLPS